VLCCVVLCCVVLCCVVLCCVVSDTPSSDLVFEIRKQIADKVSSSRKLSDHQIHLIVARS
jgi:hypothetical protein